MSDRIDFYEIRKGDPDDWDHVCMCKDEDDAEMILNLLINREKTVETPRPQYFIHHTEIVAQTHLEMNDY